MPVLPLADVFHAGFRRLVPNFTRFAPVLPRTKPSPLKSMERHEKRASTDGFRECPLTAAYALIVSAIERVSAHALARLERDGNAGTCHE